MVDHVGDRLVDHEGDHVGDHVVGHEEDHVEDHVVHRKMVDLEVDLLESHLFLAQVHNHQNLVDTDYHVLGHGVDREEVPDVLSFDHVVPVVDTHHHASGQ